MIASLLKLRDTAAQAVSLTFMRSIQAIEDYKTFRLKIIADYGMDALPPAARSGRSIAGLVEELGDPESWIEQRDAIIAAFDAHIDHMLVHIRGLKHLPSFFHPDIRARCESEVHDGDYESALLKAFRLIEVKVRAKAELPMTDVGLQLMTNAMGKGGRLKFSEHAAEQDGYHQLFRAAISVLKNPLSHKEVEHLDYGRTLERLAFASMLLKDLDDAEVQFLASE